jgi:hypothetical protein
LIEVLAVSLVELSVITLANIADVEALEEVATEIHSTAGAEIRGQTAQAVNQP